jgi:TatA/E family protein of Tat protein translocase
LFGIGGWELFLIAGLALLLFGPDKLPEFARTLGRLVRDFKRYQDLMESTIKAEMYSAEPATRPDPFKKGKEFRERVAGGEFDSAGEETPGDESDETDAVASADSDSSAAPEATADDGAASENSDETDAGPAHASASTVPAELPADHPLHDAYAAGEDIGLDDDVDLASLDPSDLGWVPGRDDSGEGGDGDEA